MHAYSIPQPEKVKATVHVKDHNIKPIRIQTTVQEIISTNINICLFFIQFPTNIGQSDSISCNTVFQETIITKNQTIEFHEIQFSSRTVPH